MDPVDAFFNLKKPFQRIIISGGTTDGRIQTNPSIKATKKRTDEGQEYVDQCLKAEHEKMFKAFKNLRSAPDADDDGRIDPSEVDPVYAKYKFHHYSQESMNLPIMSSRDEILSKISDNAIVVVEGSTGCGKSTQLPQMILDDAYKKKKPCNIIVTQPRRIGARSIAERVSRERKWDLGSVVGYQIALDLKFVSEDTRILFCTTGLLLEKLIKTQTMANYTHIILDEVHERDKNMDFLFIVIRMLLYSNSPNVKIILMSATIEAPKFAEYFKTPCGKQMVPAPIIKVEKKNTYTVKEFYLDDFSKMNNMNITVDWENANICDEMYNVVLKLVVLMKRLDEYGTADGKLPTTLPSILIFLPGIYEIGRLYTILNDHLESHKDTKWKLLVLHSFIGTEEQHSIFRSVDADVRKIILSTNIAESSITVPDVKYVVDFCLTKSLQTQSATNFTSLQLQWASRNNCRQRSGRAGRVMNGRCYRMIPRKFFDCYMDESPVPELLRSPLENIVLKAKILEMGPPHTILALAMDPPKLSDIANTVLVLKELGALLSTSNGVASTHDGDITFIGRVMANLPIDVQISRLIMIGYCFGVLEECIIIGAGLNVKSIFKNAFQNGLAPYSRKLEWSNGSGSDLFAVLNAYKVWSFKHNQREFGSSDEQRRAEKEFGTRHFLEIRSLHDCHMLIDELKQRLDRLGIREPTGIDRVIWNEQEKSIILKVVISGAFYPHYFARSTFDGQKYEREAYHVLNGRDPCSTVFYTGFSQRYIRQLYVNRIKDLLCDHVVDESNLDNVKISFGENTEKVYVTFKTNQTYGTTKYNDWDTHRSSIPGKIVTEVYKAVKMRKLNMPNSIRVLRPADAIKTAEKLGLGFMDGSNFIMKQNFREDIENICMPRLMDKVMVGTITHIESCESFWFHPKTETSTIERYFNELNSNIRSVTKSFCIPSEVEISTVVAARDPTDGKFYRARVLSIDYGADLNEFNCTVLFIDYGHKAQCEAKHLRIFKPNIEQQTMPPRCFECCLAEIQPSTMNANVANVWDYEANELFKTEINKRNGNISAEIYSLVNGVAHVFIFVNKRNINEILTEKGFGEYSEENYMSKANHWKRQHKQQYPTNTVAFSVDGDEDVSAFYPCEEAAPVEPPPRHLCHLDVQLRGPFSPLETKIFSTMRSGSTKSIAVDPLSVNSILLDNNVQDCSEKYMVAAVICQNSMLDSKLIVRETTLMPNLRGFGPLMALLFCPTMEIKRDVSKSRFISIITGLGYSVEEQRPIFEEHDNIFNLDFELTQDDLDIINQMRYCFDSLMFTFEGQEKNENISHKNKTKILNKIKELIISLLSKKRNAIELHTEFHAWNQYDKKDVIQPESIYGNRAIFPLLNSLELYPLDYALKRKLQQHCAELHQIEKMKINLPRPITCKLCAIDIENMALLRIHIISRLHLDREEQIGFKSN